MKYFCLVLYLLSTWNSFGQNTHEVVFYNVENLFDNQTDSSRKYNEFNTGGRQNWNEYRYYKKINSVAKVLAAACDDGPEFIGFTEVENEQVVRDVLRTPLLVKYNYETIHIESDDVRGIDVAFAYKSSVYNLLNFRKIKIPRKRRSTRDILCIRGVHKATGDTLTFYINHWPSRYGGKLKSEKSRILAAKILSKEISINKQQHPFDKIIVTGDFNDTPTDPSINSLEKSCNLKHYAPQISSAKGTIKYKRNWQHFDFFLCSKNWIKNKGLKITKSTVFNPRWLLEKDIKYGGVKPFRTYLGPKYHAGISDHLPIILYITY